MTETTALMVEPDPSREVSACEALAVLSPYIPGTPGLSALSGASRICGVEHAPLGEKTAQVPWDARALWKMEAVRR